MPAPRSPRRARLAALVSVVLAISGFQFFLAPPAAQANPGGTGLVISEVYGAGGNAGASRTHDFIELYNPTASAINVSTWSVQYRSATGNTAQLTNLTGSVPAGGYYLIQEASQAAVGAAMPTPNASGSIAMSGSNGVVILANDQVAVTAQGNFAAGSVPTPPANVVDAVGFGTTPTTFEGTNTNVALTATTSAQRNASGADTDANNPDFTEAVPTPTNAAGETGPSGPLTVNTIGNKTGTVGAAITPFTVTATGGTGPYSWSANGTLPAGVSINATTGQVTGTPTTEGSSNVVITATDSALPTAATDTEAFTFTIAAAPVGVTPIADIQGTGVSTPIPGQVVQTEGVVTASYPTGGFNGFYMQTPGADTPNASDAIFVYGGPGGFASYPAIGDSVDVTGTVGENFGKTELSSATWTPHGSSLGTVTPKTLVPGTDCALPGSACDTIATLDVAREAAEGEAFQPTGTWTLTDVYDGGPFYGPGITNSSANHGELGVAAESTKALVAPTELFDVQTQATEVTNRGKWNDAHRIIVDDGSSLTYSTTANDTSPFPWMTPTYVPRVGAAITFPAPTILIKDFSAWRLLPSSQVVGAPSPSQPQLQQTRAANAAPQDVGGDVKLATFNVLNFFPTHGNEYETLNPDNHCTYFNDRQGNQITTNACGNPLTSSGNGPRGAANAVNVTRQRDKIVSAINTANADIVSLEELENSAKFGKPRDFAITQLVNALNVGNPGKWAFAPSPIGGDLPALADEDVIRTGFIYQPANVSTVGTSKILVGSAAFANAREPLAQVFKKVGSPGSDGFAVVVNHFKSKGSGVDDGTGQGNANPDRIAQANALVTFANQFQAARGVTRTFLVGDFNAYSHEDPIDVLTAAGFAELHSTSDPDEESYNFDGQIGSLDHVLANGPAAADVSGVDVWPINGYESVYYEYSRFNYNVTDLYSSGPFRSSDHSPEIVGIDVAAPTTRDIQILATNDFHGRIANDPLSASAGAGVMAGAVNQLRAENPDTVFAAAGDLIGASTFESFIQNDKPTIDALNEAGLEVSSVGNHEFDQGYDDLVDRVMAPESASNPDGGAEWQYLGANVRFQANDDPALPSTWTKDFGDVTVGFVGVVTEHLPELVSPGGIEDIEVTDIVEETNAAAEDLKTNQDADIVVMLVHEGAPMTDCAQIGVLAPNTDFGSIVQGVDENVDAIVSGHTHLAYNCSFPVQAWVDEGRPVTQRPVVSAGQYGTNLNRVVFTVDSTTHEVQAKSQAILALKSCANSVACTNYPLDQPTQDIVDDAVAEAAVLGAVPLGQIAGPIRRGYLANGTTENRGVESSAGNLVAEAQRWQTSGAEAGSAQIAFMNPGGLRTDMVGLDTPEIPGPDPYPRTLTYKQAAEMQPFANGLVNMDLTGAQIKAALEQQWQPVGSSRPFLKLGASAGFTYISDPDAAQGSRITGMWLNGVPIEPSTVYSVTVNGFLSTGGDNFGAFAGGTNKLEAGLTDLQAMVNYFDEFANTGEGDPPLPVPTKQNGVHVNFPVGAPATYEGGDTVAFDVSGWSFSNAGDPKDTEVVVKLGATTLGTAPLDNTIQAALPGFDATGTAPVSVTLPAVLPDGTVELHLTGATTGSDVIVPIQADDGLPDTTVSAPDGSVQKGLAASVVVTVTPADADGTVSVLNGATVIGSATLAAGSATVNIPANLVPAVGVHELNLAYSGEAAVYSPSTGTFTLTVTKAASVTVAPDVTVAYGQPVPVEIAVTGPAGVPTGSVQLFDGVVSLGTATLDAGGEATITVPAKTFPVGSKSLTAVYSGDANNLTSQDTLTVTTNKAAASVNALDVNVIAGQQGTANVTVSAAGVTPTGQVTFKNGATVLGTATLNASGMATFTLPLVPDGTVLTADYAGDANVATGSDTFIVHVGKATPTVTAVDTSVQFGKAATVTVHVAAPGVTPTGTVTIRNGGTTLGTGTVSGGTATVTLPAQSLPVGTANLTAEYGGDANLGAGVDSFTVSVSKATSKTKADVKPNNLTPKKKVKLIVEVEGSDGVEATGQVKIKVDGDTMTKKLKNGKLKLDLGKFGKGKHKVKVVYLGSSTVEGSDDKVTFKVT